jgi:hypothetical protein
MSENPLIPVVRSLSPDARRAMYTATAGGPLQRHTWNGCVFHRAGAVLGENVQSLRQAARTFGTTRRSVIRFILVWDELAGSDERCTALLRDALEAVNGAAAPAPPPAGLPPAPVEAEVEVDRSRLPVPV